MEWNEKKKRKRGLKEEHMRNLTKKGIITLASIFFFCMPNFALAGNKLVLLTYPSEVNAGEWTTKYTVQRQDDNGNPVTAGRTKVFPSSTSDGDRKEFSSIQSFPPPLPPGSSGFSITIREGKSSVDFYYYDEKAGNWTITYSADSVDNDSKNLRVNRVEAEVISILSGDNQSSNIGTNLPDFLAVIVTDRFGNGINGIDVHWSITETPASTVGQILSLQTAVSDSEGKAGTMLTFGDKSGNYKIQASSSSLSCSPVTFNAFANSGKAHNISMISGGCQSGFMNTVLTEPFVVKVTDEFGNPIRGVTLSWSIAESPTGAVWQELSDVYSSTDSDGEASTILTLGEKAGLYTVEATCSDVKNLSTAFTVTTDRLVSLKGGNYNTFSIPYLFNNGNPEAVLNALGPYNPSKWRLFRLSSSGEYQEYPGIHDFSPGMGYWLISAEDIEITLEGEAVYSDITLILEPGWNQIGCPFTCSVSWDDIKKMNLGLFASNAVADVLWGYDDERLEFAMRDAVDPWQSYYVYNSSGSSINLIIPNK